MHQSEHSFTLPFVLLSTDSRALGSFVSRVDSHALETVICKCISLCDIIDPAYIK